MRDPDPLDVLTKMVIALLLFFGILMLVDIRSALREQAAAQNRISISLAKIEGRYSVLGGDR